MSEAAERPEMNSESVAHEGNPFPRKPVHIIGVGGSATRGLACFLRQQGYPVSGSDQDAESRSLLEKQGITFHEGHQAQHLPEDVHTVVHTRAIDSSNPELQEARQRPGVEIYTYSQYLGQISSRLSTFAVAGTHGKTSTTACLFSVFQAAERDPSMIVGGEVVQLRAGWHQGQGDEFLVEACEFDRAFLDLKPKAVIITNVDLDHPEVYSDLESVRKTFREFLVNLEDGSWVICPVEVKKALKQDDRLRWRTYGEDEAADLQWKMAEGNSGPGRVIWKWGAGSEFAATLQVPGAHSRSNASAVVALAQALGISEKAIAQGLENYQGVCRRFEKREVLPDIEWIEDYAHHPEEVRATLDTALEVYPDLQHHVLFQPHQATRLQAFHQEFADELAKADRVSLVPIFSVRENLQNFPPDLIEQLAEGIRQRGKECQVYSFEEAISELPQRLNGEEVLISIGAGNVYEIGESIGERYRGQVSL